MDIFFTEKRKYAAAVSVPLVLCLLMITFPATALMSGQEALNVWLDNVVPSLFPFFVCINFLGEIGADRYLPVKVYPLIMSVFAGYPSGPLIIGNMRRKGEISTREAENLLSYCSTSGPVFMLGTVGAGFLGSHRAGTIIVVSHYLGCLCNYLVFSRKSTGRPAEKPLKLQAFPDDYMECLTFSVIKAFRSLIMILVYITIFMLITEILLKAVHIPEETAVEAVFKGFFEMTGGCSCLASAEASIIMKTAVASAVISWGGLSVILQTLTMISGCGISAFYVVKIKAFHGIFAGIISVFLAVHML